MRVNFIQNLCCVFSAKTLWSFHNLDLLLGARCFFGFSVMQFCESIKKYSLRTVNRCTFLPVDPQVKQGNFSLNFQHSWFFIQSGLISPLKYFEYNLVNCAYCSVCYKDTRKLVLLTYIWNTSFLNCTVPVALGFYFLQILYCTVVQFFSPFCLNFMRGQEVNEPFNNEGGVALGVIEASPTVCQVWVFPQKRYKFRSQLVPSEAYLDYYTLQQVYVSTGGLSARYYY